MKDCNQCGKCCTKYSNEGLTASAAEIDFWDDERPHIMEYVSDGKIWMDPKTGKQLDRCPWLRKAADKNIYTCDIYFDRPNDCRYYPVTVDQMVSDECEMLEKIDFLDFEKAQKKLDRLMEDSRPSLD